MGLWSQEVMNKTLSSCTNQLCDLESYLNSLGFNFLVYKAGNKVDCFMEQFGGCSRNVLLLPLSSLVQTFPLAQAGSWTSSQGLQAPCQKPAASVPGMLRGGGVGRRRGFALQAAELSRRRCRCGGPASFYLLSILVTGDGTPWQITAAAAASEQVLTLPL